MKISRKNALLACILSLTCGLSISHAATVTWTGTTNSNWGTATNWDTGNVPVSGDTININAGDTVNNESGRTLSNNTIELSGTWNVPNYLALTSGTTLNIRDGAVFSQTASDVHVTGATINQYGGSVKSRPSSGGNIWFNIGEGGTGYYNMYGGTLDALNLYAGRYNVGHMTIDAAEGKTAAVTATNFYVGYGASLAGDSSLELKNGSITVSYDFRVGGGAEKRGNNAGKITFDMTGGTLTTNCKTQIGYYVEKTNFNNITNQAAMTVSGGVWNQNGHLWLGVNDIVEQATYNGETKDVTHKQTASLTIKDGATVNFKYDVIIGQGAGTGDGTNMAATLTLAGGTTTVLANTSTATESANAVCVGNGKNNTAKLLITGGTNTFNKPVYMMGLGTAEMSISGGTLNTFNQSVIYGNKDNNKGTGTISGGTNNFVGGFYVGNGAGATADVTISGGTNTFSGGLVVGNKTATTSATLTISGGTNEITSDVNISGTNAELKITGSSMDTTDPDNPVAIAHTFQGKINITIGDTVKAQTIGTGDEKQVIPGGTLTLSGGTTTFNLINNTLIIGRNGGDGVMNISGDAVVNFTGYDIHVGNNDGGTGTINQTGGTFTFVRRNQGTEEKPNWQTGCLNIGEWGTGEYNLSGGTLDITKGNFYIGRRGSGTFTVSDNGILKAGSLTMGYNTAIVPESKFIIEGGEATLTGISIGNLNECGSYKTTTTSGTNTLTVKNTGKLTVNGGITIGNTDVNTTSTYAATGIMNLEGGTTKVTGNIVVGNGVKASGTFNISGGTNTLNEVFVGHNVTIKSEMNVSGGETTLKKLYVGGANGSTGTVNLKGGTFTTTGDVAIGRAAGDTATMNISGGTNTLFATYVGTSGATTGLLNVTGGTTTTQNLYIAKDGNSTGKVTISGGKFTSASTTANCGMIAVGSYNENDTTSIGTLEISDKATVEARYLRAGTYSTGTTTTNSIKMTGGTFTLKATDSGRNWIGNNGGSATLEISGGTFKASYADFVVGYNNTGNGYGVMTVSGTGTFNQHGTGNFIIQAGPGNDGKGNILNLTDEGTIDTLWFSLGQFGNSAAGAKATFNMDGGTLKIGNNMRLGMENAATANISGGTINVNGAIQLDTSSKGSTLNLTGAEATIKAGSLSLSASGKLNVTAGSMLDDSGNVQAPFSTFQITGTADVQSTINIDMSAYVCDGFYVGDTLSPQLISAGTLNYNPASVSITGPWKIDSTTGGKMTLALDTTNASHVTVNPGETFALDNLGQSGWIDVTGTAGEEYDLSIYYTGVDDSDVFENWVSSNLFGNNSDVTVSTEGNVMTFSGLQLDSLGKNQLYYDLSKYGDGKAIFAAEPSHVPEPATWVLLVLGLIGLYRIRSKA